MHKLAPLFSVAVALSSILGGCVVHTEPEPIAYAEVTAAPVGVDLYAYPHTYYAGRPVYYYGNRWWYQSGGNWVYYPTEPVPLYRYRQRPYIQQAPPALRGPVYAPPATSAPPAVRVQ